jgi:hypothetical protein
MSDERSQKISDSMRKVWEKKREEIMQKRELKSKETKQKQSEKIKEHYAKDTKHRVAISNAQKQKWARYKNAIKYCEDEGINLD